MCKEIQQEKGDENQTGQNEKDELEEINEDVSCPLMAIEEDF